MGSQRKDDVAPRRSWLRSPRWLGIAASVTTVLVIDSLAGLAYRTGTAVRVHVVTARAGASTETTVLFPGYIMPGDIVTESLRPHLPSGESLLVVEYAQRGIDMEEIYQAVMTELQKLSPRRLRIYGASMGGMCAADFLARYTAAGAPLGEPVLVLDTAPSTRADVKRPDILFGVARVYRGGPLTSALWAGATSLGKTPPETEPGADDRLVNRGHSAGAWAGMPALTSQANFIADSVPPAPGSAKAARVVYLQGVRSENDPLIRVAEAIDGWRRSFPSLEVQTVTARDGRWHTPVIERPQETLQALLAV